MRLALLGADEEALALVRWAVTEGGHRLVAAFDVGTEREALAAIAPAATLGDEWESLVLGTSVDGVIVARAAAGLATATGIADDERRSEQLRKLTQAAVPLLVLHPGCDAIVGFELEMIRRDSHGVIVPLVPFARGPAIEALVGLISPGEALPIGPVEQVVFERGLADRSRANVLTAFARDAAILRQLVGPIRTISALGPALPAGRDPLGPKPKEPPPLANLNVHVSAEGGPPARWSVVPSHAGPQASITLIGQTGTAVLQMPGSGPWQLQIVGSETQATSFPQDPGYEQALAQLSPASHAFSPDDSAWLNACRDQEAAEAIDRSLTRGRTIELFNEQHSEEESFKGIMAMGGCLMLLAALGVLFLATVVEGLRLPLRDWVIWQFWPIYLLVPIAVFLLLQLLQLAIKKEGPDLRQLVGGSDGGR